MTAGERVFVDLLPDTWSGPPPSLPDEVIRELAERARVAERALRQQRAGSGGKEALPIRVRTSVQPTFVRFVFEMPDGVGVSSVLNEQKLTLKFNAVLTFDLADAKVGGAAEYRLDQSEDRGRRDRGGNGADRRCRRPLLPRGQELRDRRRLPAGRESRRRCRRRHRRPRMLRRQPLRRQPRRLAFADARGRRSGAAAIR